MTTCEHCKTVLRVPLMPGSPQSGYMHGGEIQCSSCGKQTQVNKAYIIADPRARPGEISYRIPAVCQRCHHKFTIDIGPPKKGLPEGAPQPINMKCPKCPGEAAVNHGMYLPIEGGVQFVPMEQQLYGKELSLAESQRLIRFFNEALQSSQLDPKAVRAAIERTPELRTLADVVPQSRDELYVFVGLVLTLLTALTGAGVWVSRAVRRRRIKQLRQRRLAEQKRKREAEEDAEARRKRRERELARARRDARCKARAAAPPRKIWHDGDSKRR